MAIKVMIVDDQPLLAEGIKSIVLSCPEMEVIATATNGEDALNKMQENLPDVLLLDIRMPIMNGVVTTVEVKKRYPSVKILMLTTFDDSEYILNALHNGACGYLLKDISSAVLLESIKNAHAGDTILPSKVAKKLTEVAKAVTLNKEIELKKHFHLSDREVEIALMLADGFNNRQITSALGLTDGTARNYISTINSKLQSKNRQDTIQKLKEILEI